MTVKTNERSEIWRLTLGPSVTETASARRFTPFNISARASLPNLRSLARPRTHCLAGAKPLRPILRNMIIRWEIKIDTNCKKTQDTELPGKKSRVRNCSKLVVVRSRRSNLQFDLCDNLSGKIF